MSFLISVIMPAWNDERTVERAVRSVLKQTDTHWELIVVDDGSTDATVERSQQLLRGERRAVLLRGRENTGPSAARNRGLRIAKGDWITYLDADDEFYPDYLRYVRHFARQADVLVFRYDVFLEEGGEPVFLGTLDPSMDLPWLLAENVAVPLGVAHKRSLIERCGGFNEDLWCLEDWELWKRFARAGATFAYLPVKSGKYYVRAESRSRRPRLSLSQQRKWGGATPPLSLYRRTERVALRQVRSVALVLGEPFGPQLTEHSLRARVLCAALERGGVRVHIWAPDSSPYAAGCERPDVSIPVLEAEVPQPRAMAAFDAFLHEAGCQAIVLVGIAPEFRTFAWLAHRRDLPVAWVPMGLTAWHALYLDVDRIFTFCPDDTELYWRQFRAFVSALPEPPPLKNSALGSGHEPLVVVLLRGLAHSCVAGARAFAGLLPRERQVVLRMETLGGFYALDQGVGEGYDRQRICQLEQLFPPGTATVIVWPLGDLPWIPGRTLWEAWARGADVLDPAGSDIVQPVGISSWSQVKAVAEESGPDTVARTVTVALSRARSGLSRAVRPSCPELRKTLSRIQLELTAVDLEPGPPILPDSALFPR